MQDSRGEERFLLGFASCNNVNLPGVMTMTIRRSLSIFLLLAAAGAAVTAAQKPVPAPPAKIAPAELEKAAQVPSLEQLILQAAAAKLREEKPPQATSVDLPVTIRRQPRPLGCYDICVGSGVHRACLPVHCNAMN
jgi:hypothetical protein